MFVVTWSAGFLRVWGVCLRYFDHVIAKANQNTLWDLYKGARRGIVRGTRACAYGVRGYEHSHDHYLRDRAGHKWARAWPVCDSWGARAWPVHFSYVGIRVIIDTITTENSANRPYAMVTKFCKTVRDPTSPHDFFFFTKNCWTRIDTVEPVAKKVCTWTRATAFCPGIIRKPVAF